MLVTAGASSVTCTKGEFLLVICGSGSMTCDTGEDSPRRYTELTLYMSVTNFYESVLS